MRRHPAAGVSRLTVRLHSALHEASPPRLHTRHQAPRYNSHHQAANPAKQPTKRGFQETALSRDGTYAAPTRTANTPGQPPVELYGRERAALAPEATRQMALSQHLPKLTPSATRTPHAASVLSDILRRGHFRCPATALHGRRHAALTPTLISGKVA